MWRKIQPLSNADVDGGGDVEDTTEDVPMGDFKPPKDSKYEKMVKPKAEIVDCKCQWGLFRDRNVTMRKPSMFMTGHSRSRLNLAGLIRTATLQLICRSLGGCVTYAFCYKFAARWSHRLSS